MVAPKTQVKPKKDPRPRVVKGRSGAAESKFLRFIRGLSVGYTAVAVPMFGIIRLVLRQRRRFYEKLSSDCVVGCFVESWDLVSQGKPIDSESPDFKRIFDAIRYYFRGAVLRRGDAFNAIEISILRTRYAEWVARDSGDVNPKSARSLVLKYRLARIFKKYVNLHNYIGYLATKEIADLETKLGLSPSVDFWRGVVRFVSLPEGLNENTKPSAVRSFLRKNVKALKRNLAQKNYRKLDVAISDITALVTLSTAWILILGFVHTYFLAWYLGFPFQDYFGTADYLKTSLNRTGEVFVGALLVSAFLLLQFATIGSYSRSEYNIDRSYSGWAASFLYHAVGLSSYPALAVEFYTKHKVDGTSLFISMLYPVSLVAPRIVGLFFVKPIQAYLVIWLMVGTLLSVLVGVVREVDRIDLPSNVADRRLVRFEDRDFSEADWQFIAFTSDYLIMRNRESRSIVVRPRSTLKAIEVANP